ncbi:LysR family transcriptional regulator [Nonomuraea sp. KC401]|uniref:LysR family transcriptional regulator n=1 Tax=unclassified Nonomuraea TaxID=2593643 RepID=UPI0010FD886B|nr:LysR family transcriptional regulator [Nonomuraea sp. KC401]NBE92617.1 LysR family transcriptional regulator [Nonomuraea sp. K271]TLF84570.1 LysR family transcriptional regulator [Nonomuraea sp. KC401]
MIDHRLRTLRVLHAEGTVTAAAARLHLTPSAVSQQLRLLADELRVPLLQPEGRRVRLTPAALALIRYAETLSSQWEEADAALDAYRTGEAGHLRITGVATAVAAIMAPGMARLRTRHPHITFDLGEDLAEDRFTLLLADQVDIVVGILTQDTPPPGDPRFDQRLLLEEPQDLLVPEHHALARRPSAELSDAAREMWIQAGDPRDQHRLLLQAASAAGFTPHVRHSAVDWFAIASLVAHGHGVCLMPRLAPLPAGLPVRRVPLTGDGVPTRKLIACFRRGSAEQGVIARGLAALREAADEWLAGQRAG